jgi:threonyl-tRNA synthetase
MPKVYMVGSAHPKSGINLVGAMSCLACLEKVLHLGKPQDRTFRKPSGNPTSASRFMNCPYQIYTLIKIDKLLRLGFTFDIRFFCRFSCFCLSFG